MTWLVLLWSLQAGYLPLQEIHVAQEYGYVQNWVAPTNATEVTMGVKATLFDHLEVGGFVKSYQAFEGVGFAAFRFDYGIHADIVWGPLTVGIMHECDHGLQLPFTQNLRLGSMQMAQTEVYVRFESKISF
jgi:hypothetical protein